MHRSCQENKPQRDKKENSVQLDLARLDQTSDTRQFILDMLSIV